MGASQSIKRTQRNSTPLHHSQREIPILSVVQAPVEIEESLVRSCRDELMAINRCIDLSGMSDEALSGALGIDKGHWSRIRKGRGHLPARARLRLMELAGNILPVQYEAMRLGYRLEPISKDEQIKRLERELQALRRTA